MFELIFAEYEVNIRGLTSLFTIKYLGYQKSLTSLFYLLQRYSKRLYENHTFQQLSSDFKLIPMQNRTNNFLFRLITVTETKPY